MMALPKFLLWSYVAHADTITIPDRRFPQMARKRGVFLPKRATMALVVCVWPQNPHRSITAIDGNVSTTQGEPELMLGACH